MKPLGQSFAQAFVLACVSLLLFAVTSASAADYEEGFESLAGSGWTTVDLSESSHIAWRQGVHNDVDSWGAHSGTPDSFVNGSLYTETHNSAQSDWLISPKTSTLSNGDLASFYVRARSVIHKLLYATEALEVRVSTNGGCSPGTTSSSVGDFDKLLLTMDTGTYSELFTGPPPSWSSPEWRELAVALSGLPAGDNTGCIAIRHATPNQWGANPLVGIDDFKFTERATVSGEIALLAPLPPSAGTRASFMIRGRADVGSIVHLSLDPECSDGQTRDVSADGFQWSGFFASAEPDVHTRVYAKLTLADGSVTDCRAIADYVYDKSPPVTTDDVGPANAYPGPVHLAAADVGGVARTYYSLGHNGGAPSLPGSKYDPAHPPVLPPGEKISYFSVDKVGNSEDVKTSIAAPIRVNAAAGGDVNASGTQLSRVRPANASLKSVRGRVSVTLICEGDSGASPCAGRVDLEVGRSQSITRGGVGYSIPAGTRKVVKLRLGTFVLARPASSRPSAPWVRVVLRPAGATTQRTSFRRKLRF